MRNSTDILVKFLGVAHTESALNAGDIFNSAGSAQVLFELDPEKDKLFEQSEAISKSDGWALVGQTLDIETKSRLTRFLGYSEEILEMPNVMGQIYLLIYAKGMAKAGLTVPTVRQSYVNERIFLLEKSIKNEFVKNLLPVNEIEGSTSYSKTMKEGVLEDYGVLINEAISCAEKSECIRNYPEVLAYSMEAKFLDYETPYRLYIKYPSLNSRTLPVRNGVMHKNILRLTRNVKNTLVVVGAAHLGGDVGLISRLKEDGFTTVSCNK
jgi:hypothetical protein